MKRIHTLLLVLANLWPGFCLAEDILQVQPFRTVPGVTSADSQYFQICLTNEEAVWGVQFDLILPEGMTLDEYPFELLSERCPSVRGQFRHGVDYGTQSNGAIRILISPNTNDVFMGESGALANVYYHTASDMPDGVYPITVRNSLIVLGGSGVRGIRPTESTSYVIVGNPPLVSSDGRADFSMLTGRVPSFVADRLWEDLADCTTLSTLDLTGTDSLGTAPVLPNPNALCLISAGTQAEMELAEAGVANIVVKDGEAFRSRRIVLDEEHACASSLAIAADEVELHRAPLTAQWNTLCLPFPLTPEQIEAAYGAGSYVQAFAGRDGEALCFYTTADGAKAHTPYLLYVPEASDAEAYAFGPVTLEATDGEPEVRSDGVRFLGNYGGTVSATGLYGVTPDSRILRGGPEATLKGFRACLDLSAEAAASVLYVRHETPTAITPSPAGQGSGVDVYTTDGRLLRRGVDAGKATEGLSRGVYIIGNKKTIIP